MSTSPQIVFGNFLIENPPGLLSKVFADNKYVRTEPDRGTKESAAVGWHRQHTETWESGMNSKRGCPDIAQSNIVQMGKLFRSVHLSLMTTEGA